VAFLANLVTTAGNPGGVTTSNDLCLYATDPSGNLVLIAREGFALPGDPVGGRTVTSILFGSSALFLATNGQDGRGTFFNDAGQLVFNVGFSDGNSGVFVANVTPVPGAAGVLGLGLAAGLCRRRR
jgi:MYXO-CTERM domain-containing protein